MLFETSFFLEVFIEDTSMAINSLQSCDILSCCFIVKQSFLRKSSNQVFVSLASFKAMCSFEIKSARLWAY